MTQKDERCLPPKDLRARRLFGNPALCTTWPWLKTRIQVSGLSSDLLVVNKGGKIRLLLFVFIFRDGRFMKSLALTDI